MYDEGKLKAVHFNKLQYNVTTLTKMLLILGNAFVLNSEKKITNSKLSY